MPALDDLIKLYFSLGFTNMETLLILVQSHNIVISIQFWVDLVLTLDFRDLSHKFEFVKSEY